MPLAGRRLQLAIAIAIAISGCNKNRLPTPEGNIAGTLAAQTIEGKPFDPATLQGKPAIVVFAWPSCPHCRHELPVAQKVADSEGASLVVVFARGTKTNAATVAKSLGITSPVLLDDKLHERYDVHAVPYTLILAPDGTATRALRGAQDEDTLRSAVADAK